MSFLKNRWFHLALGIILSAGITFGLVFLLSIQPAAAQHSADEARIAELSAKLDETDSSLQAVSANLESTKTDLSATSEERDTLKADATQKQAELDRINQEIESVRTDLESSKVELDKAKRGVNHLKKLDSLFATYDSQSEELSEVLTRYYDAASANDYNAFIQAEQQYDTLASAIEVTYNNIQKVLDDFRNGKY